MSNYVGIIGEDIATYAVVSQTGNSGGKNIYRMIDCTGNVLILETDETIDKVDGKHFFLVEAIVKEHRENSGEKQTVLKECDCGLIDKCDNIRGLFFGEVGDDVELNNVVVTFRKTSGPEWKVTGEFNVVTPESEFRMVIPQGRYLYLMPFDTQKKITSKTEGKYNIYAKVVGYTIEKGCRATFLYPTRVECKNGPLYGGSFYNSLRSVGYFGVGARR